MGAKTMFSLEGKVGVITGGAAGLGRATAERFDRLESEVTARDSVVRTGRSQQLRWFP
jgi:NAD(P)-dependent dehydrogenase (short-subunit alcohol dehydrogenase family)